MVQLLETDPEKLREWQVSQLIVFARSEIDPRGRPEFKQSFINHVAEEAAHTFRESGQPITFNRAMNLADDACKTVFAERGMTF